MEFAFHRDCRRPSANHDPKHLEQVKKEAIKTLQAFLIELAIYAVLVIGYFFLVLHFLGGWLHQLETHHRYTYAGVAILLMMGQAVLLQYVTTFLLRLIRGGSE